MALLTQDRVTLARMTHALSKRVADKKASKQLTSITNKLTHGNPLSPSDRDLLVVAVQGLLASPPPPIPAVPASLLDYVLVVPAVKKALKKRQLKGYARAARQSFQDALTRL